MLATFFLVVGAISTALPARAATGFDAALTRAPYLTDLVNSNVNVNWATDQSATTGSLSWGPLTGGACNLNQTATPTRRTVAVGTVNEYQWTASLTLPSQGTYCYRPFLAGRDLLATAVTPQFQSQVPAGDTTPFSFDVFGDYGYVGTAGSNPDQARLMSQMSASGARFAVSVGDAGYPNGSEINYGDLQQTGGDTSAIFGPSYWTVAGSKLPLFNAAGNHGLSNSTHTDITTWTQNTAVSTSGGRYVNDVYCCVNGSSSANYGSEWYAFDAGPARFYVLDSAWGDTNGGTATPYANDAAAHFAPGTPEYTWLVNDLQAHPNTLKFSFSHYPFYADNPNQSSDTSLTGANHLESLLAQYGVKLVFNGHAHLYQRNRASAPGMPITYTTGGGGAVLEPIGPCTSIDAYGIGWSPTRLTGSACGSAATPTAAAQVFHFLKVTVNGGTVTVAPTDSNGTTFDVQTYTFGSAPDTVIDSPPPPNTNSTSASISFHATLTGATFACSLDGRAATACTSPAAYSALAAGPHTFSVAATTSGGRDTTPATANWTVDTSPPSTPTNLTATTSGSPSVQLSWTASTDNVSVASYDVFRDGTKIGTATAPATSYVDSGASPATSYSYTVLARDTAGNASGQSAPATVTTPQSAGGPALVQAATSSTTTVTLPGSSAPGDLLVLSAGVYTGTSRPITAVTDDAGNTWTKVGAYAVSGQNSDGEMWYAANAAPARSITVATTAVVALSAQEFSGVARTSPLDAATGAAGTGKSAASGAVTPTAKPDLAVGFAAGHANSQTITVGGGFAAGAQQNTGGSSLVSVISGSQVLPTTSLPSTTFSGTFANAMYWAAGVALFKPAAPLTDDFSVGASPSAINVTGGNTATTSISTSVTAGSPQNVAFSAAGLPAGATASFDPASAVAGASSQLSIATVATTPAGTYSVTITATGSSTTHSTSVQFTVTAPDDFSIAASPGSVSVPIGGSGTSTITTATTSGNPQSLKLTTSGLPSGATATLSSSSVTSGDSPTLTLATGSSVAPGTYQIAVTATGTTATHSTTVALTVAAPNDFSMSADPASLTVTAGQSVTAAISTAPVSGTAETVAFTATGAPSGMTVAFAPTSVSAGGTSTMTVTTDTTLAPGGYSVTVTGTTPDATHTLSVPVTVSAADDFTISATPASLTLVQGQSGTSTISSAVAGGNAQTISLTASTGGAPAGLTATVSPGTVTAGAAATLTVATASDLQTGTYPVTVTGTGAGGGTHTSTVSVTVKAPDDFTLTANPTALTVAQGRSGSGAINTVVSSGAGQTVTLSASGAPSGVTVSFAPQQVTGTASSSMTIAVAGGVPTGSYPLTITGTGSSATHSTTVTLTVGVGTAPRLVQAAGQSETATATSLTVTLPAPSTAGNLLVLSAGVYTGTTNLIASVTDSGGNTWTKVKAFNVASHNSDGELWYTANATSATTVTVKVSLATSMALEVQEFAGVATTNALDTVNGTASTSTAADSGVVTPATGELVIGFVAGHANAQKLTPAPTGYTVQPQVTSSATSAVTTLVTGYQVAASTTPLSFGATFPAAMYWAAGTVTFRAG